MGKWAEGRTLSKNSWSLLGQNKYFLWFPVIGLILALLPLAVFGIPALVLLAYDSELLGIILAALCLVFVNYAFTLSGAALVSAADEELAGKDASVGYGFGKAFGKLVPLFVWAIIRAVVSAFLLRCVGIIAELLELPAIFLQPLAPQRGQSSPSSSPPTSCFTTPMRSLRLKSRRNSSKKSGARNSPVEFGLASASHSLFCPQ